MGGLFMGLKNQEFYHGQCQGNLLELSYQEVSKTRSPFQIPPKSAYFADGRLVFGGIFNGNVDYFPNFY